MRPNIDLSQDWEGELYQQQAARSSRLRWSQTESNVLVSGISERTALSNIRDAIIALQKEFSSEGGPRVVIESNKIHAFEKRFLLIENEIEGLMKRRINFSIEDQEKGQRFLDYTGLLNEKENQIVELEKKINNLEERLRRANVRQISLENEILHINQKLLTKQAIIISKNEVILAEVAATNSMKESIGKLKKNLETNKNKISTDISNIILSGVILPDIGGFEIKADILTKQGAQGRSQTYTQGSESQRNKTKVIQMFRQFERFFQQSKECTKDQIEKIIQGFLIQLQGTRLYESVQVAIRRQHIQEQMKRLRENFSIAAGIYQSNIQKMKIDNPNIQIKLEKNLFEILQRESVQACKVEGGAVFVSDFSQKTVEVPIQDARTKHLLHLFAFQLKRLFNKYPKLHSEIDGRLVQFFQQQIIDCMEVDEVDRLVEIVKYQPQVVKVENVYAYSNEKSRKIQYHLRVLIKALLEQLQKVKIQTGVVLEMDEGVVAMIRQQIMGMVEVDDILKVFRVVTKIVEVEKIVQKIVEKIVEVPKVITIDRIVEKIVQIQKIREVERIVNIPLEQPMVYERCVEKVVPLNNTVEKIVEVPRIIEKIVEVIREVPKIVEVERIQQKVVEVDRVVEVERVVNHIEKEYQEIQVAIEKVVTVEKIVQIIKEVPVIVQKIVEKVVEVVKVVEVEKIVEKLVPVVEYKNAREVHNHIEVQHEIVERIVEKPIPIIQTVERIVEVPQVIEKIVQVVTIQTQIVEVQVIVEKIVIKEVIKEILKIETQTIEVIKQVPVEIDRYIQIPIIHERIKIVQQFIEKPVIQRIETTVIQEVYLRDPLIIKQPKIVEVEKIVNHYIEVPKPVKYIEEKIVEVEKIVYRIKEVRVQVDKIIQKMIEVPKVVEVERVVQKIVIVPRVVEKVVEVPQIVEKVVQKLVIKQVIKEIQRIVEVPVFQDRVVQVPIERNIFIEVEKAVQRIVDKLVEVPRLEQVIQIKEIIQEKIVEVIREIPVTMQVDKIVTLYADNVKLIEIQKPIIVPAQIPVPVDRIVEKLVIQEEIRQKIVQVPQIIEKIVTVREQEVIVHQIEKIVERIVVDTKIKEVEKIVPYIQQIIKQIPTIVEKIVPIITKVEEIITAQQIVEKIIERTITVPKIHVVECLREKVVEVPQFCQIQKIVPQLVRVNNYIQNVVEKIIQVPIIIEQLKQVEREVEKIVKVQNETEKLIEVQRNVEKIVIMEKLKQVVRDVNYIEQVLHVVEKLEQLPFATILKEEVIIQVPYILEKIVERIIVMPQIVEVLKYVYEITQTEQLGVAVGIQDSIHQQKFTSMSKQIKTHLDVLLKELRVVKQGNPKLKQSIDTIEKFLGQFDNYLINPRIIKGIEQRIVEKSVQVQKIVQVPTDSQRSLRMELTLSLLVEKLILELKRVKQTANIKLELDEDINLIFFSDLNTRSKLEGSLAPQFEKYSNNVMRKFDSMGKWSIDHQSMLNSFLQQRFMMAELVHEANVKITQANETGERRLDALRRYKKDKNEFAGYINQMSSILSNVDKELKEDLSGLFEVLDRFENYEHIERHQPLKLAGEMMLNERASSNIRQKQEEIYRLRALLSQAGSKYQNQDDQEIKRLRFENAQLRSKVNLFEQKNDQQQIDRWMAPIKDQVRELQAANFDLESQNSSLISEIINLQAENRVLRQLTGDSIRNLGQHEQFGGSFSPIRSQFQRGGTHMTSESRRLIGESGETGSLIQGTTVSGRGNNERISPQNIKQGSSAQNTALKGTGNSRGDSIAYQGDTPTRAGDFKQWSSGQQGTITPVRELDSWQNASEQQKQQLTSQYNVTGGQRAQIEERGQDRTSGLSASQHSSRAEQEYGSRTGQGNQQIYQSQSGQQSSQLGQSRQSGQLDLSRQSGQLGQSRQEPGQLGQQSSQLGQSRQQSGQQSSQLGQSRQQSGQQSSQLGQSRQQSSQLGQSGYMSQSGQSGQSGQVLRPGQTQQYSSDQRQTPKQEQSQRRQPQIYRSPYDSRTYKKDQPKRD